MPGWWWRGGGLRGFLRDCSLSVRVLSLAHIFGHYGFYASVVQGPSMFPTFNGRDEYVVVQAVSPLLGPITRGDVVICTRPVNPAEHIIKRVTAVAGESVVLFPDREHAEVRTIKVPKGHVWLQGDNIILSRDSREYGPIPLALVKGRVMFQVWPTLKRVSHEPLGAQVADE